MRRILTGVAAATLVLLPVTAAGAASPSQATLSPSGGPVAWQGANFDTGAVQDPAVCPASVDSGDDLCDHFALTVDGPVASAAVTISWADSADDFDLYIYQNGAQVASSSQGGTASESATLLNADGTYEVRVNPYLVTGSDYDGVAEVTSVSTPPPSATGGATPGGPAAFTGTPITGANPEVAPENSPAAYDGPALTLKTTDVGREAAEPTIGVDADGNAFYGASTFDSVIGQARTVLLRSTDSNGSWQEVQPVVAGEDTHPQTLDPYTYVDPITGRVFFDDLLLAGGSELSTSDDQGDSFTTTFANDAAVNDHQTITTGVVPAASGLVTAGYPNLTYQCVNQIANVQCSRSLDGGLTFTPTPGQPFPTHNANGFLCSSLTGHLATDPDGRVFLASAFNSCGPPRLAISDDGMNTFRESVISDTIGDAIHDVYVAADEAGNIYATYQDDVHHLPYLVVSTDHGMTWGDPIMVAPPGVKEVNFPSLDAGADGRVAISFPGTTVDNRDDKTRPWNSYVMVSTNATDAAPLFVSNIANPADDPIHRGDCTGRCGGMLDFLDVTVEPNALTGGPAWATAVDTCTDQNECVTKGAAGSATDMRGLAIKQISGPALLGDQPFLALSGPVVPEVPSAAMLPVAAALLLAGTVAIGRRRRGRAAGLA